jgi:alpha-tubulin suppressor-like RCC1 family protein
VKCLSLGGQHSAAVSALHDSSTSQENALPPKGPSSGQKVHVLHTWGFGEYGVLGHGEHCPEYSPRLVSISLGESSNSEAHEAAELQEPQVSAGGTHTLVKDEAGRVLGCGRDERDSGVLGVDRREIPMDGIAIRLAQVWYTKARNQLL